MYTNMIRAGRVKIELLGQPLDHGIKLYSYRYHRPFNSIDKTLKRYGKTNEYIKYYACNPLTKFIHKAVQQNKSQLILYDLILVNLYQSKFYEGLQSILNDAGYKVSYKKRLWFIHILTIKWPMDEAEIALWNI